jgi:UDP-N-acetylmuramoylalanine--D-glutamate ligase
VIALKDQHVLILGLGASGLAMARWCVRCGARVTVADTRAAPPQLETLRRELPAANFVSGEFAATMVEGSDIRAVFKSPGLSPASVAPLWTTAQAMGLWVGGELDLFARALADLKTVTAPVQESPSAPPEVLEDTVQDAAVEAQSDALPGDDGDAKVPVVPVPVPEAAPHGYTPKILAVTGTNGKTTVTSLTGQLVERTGKTVAVAGNIGPTLLDTLAQRLEANELPEVWVLELSSFQLDGVQGFEPTAATVLNLTQDHLDWHGSMDAYAAAKSRVFGSKGLMVLNREDALVMAMLPAPVKGKGSRVSEVREHVTFGADMPQRPGDFGIEHVNGMAWLVRAQEADETRKKRKGEEEEEIFIQRLMPADALRIRGRHNATNALAALALAQAAGCSLAPILYGLREYRGEPHRVESVGIVDEVEYFDDSKGTNVGATVAAIHGLGDDAAGPGGSQRKLVIILGGDGKGQDFAPLAVPVARHARAVVLIGRDAPLIRNALQGSGVPLLDADSMPQAVTLAHAQAHAGDAVLMSPACASFDMFDNYEHRARVFCDAVAALTQDGGVA